MIVIGERKFEVPPPRGMKSFAFQQEVLPIATGVAQALASGLRSAAKGKDGGFDLANMLSAEVLEILPAVLPSLGRIFADMPDGKLERITRTLLSDAKCDGVPLFMPGGGDPFDMLMAGRTEETWVLMLHALGVWYPDFFVRARRLFTAAKGANASGASTTSPTSGPATGSSSASGAREASSPS